MAYAGLQRGHTTVAEALADPFCARWVQEFWDETERSLPARGLNIAAYRSALLERFSDQRISHRLSQIATDGTNKLRMRAVPVIKAELAAGRPGTGALRIISARLSWVRGTQAIQDPAIEAIKEAMQQKGRKRTASLAATIDMQLAPDPAALALTEELAGAVRS